MTDTHFAALAVAATTVGSLHSLAPDHWVPLAAVGRARSWSGARVARVTFLCGFGHVTVSVLLALLALAFGLQAFEAFGRRLESVASVLLVGFGLAYLIWGLRRVAGERLHGHRHARYDHVHDPSRVTAWTLFLLYCSDPCVALIPILIAAAPLGAGRTITVVAVYEVATIGTMLGLVVSARAGAARLHAPWLDRYGDALAGGVIVAVGLAVGALGW